MMKARLQSSKGSKEAHLVDQLHQFMSALCVGFVQRSQLFL